MTDQTLFGKPVNELPYDGSQKDEGSLESRLPSDIDPLILDGASEIDEELIVRIANGSYDGVPHTIGFNFEAWVGGKASGGMAEICYDLASSDPKYAKIPFNEIADESRGDPYPIDKVVKLYLTPLQELVAKGKISVSGFCQSDLDKGAAPLYLTDNRVHFGDETTVHIHPKYVRRLDRSRIIPLYDFVATHDLASKHAHYPEDLKRVLNITEKPDHPAFVYLQCTSELRQMRLLRNDEEDPHQNASLAIRQIISNQVIDYFKGGQSSLNLAVEAINTLKKFDPDGLDFIEDLIKFDFQEEHLDFSDFVDRIKQGDSPEEQYMRSFLL